MPRFPRRLLLLAMLGCVAGCGGSSPYVPVSGRVLFLGKPLAGAKINFQPADATRFESLIGSIGTTDDDGRFTLTVISAEKQSGAAVGKHNVVISKADRPSNAAKEESSGPAPQEVVPAKYNTKSILTFDVPPGGTTKANFDLQ